MAAGVLTGVVHIGDLIASKGDLMRANQPTLPALLPPSTSAPNCCCAPRPCEWPFSTWTAC